MIRDKIRTILSKLLLGNKIALGIATILASTTVGFGGVAAAQSNNDPNVPSIVTMCKNDYKQLGYKNVGDCVSHNNGHGHGYGGNGSGDKDHGIGSIFSYINNLFAKFISQMMSFLSHFKL